MTLRQTGGPRREDSARRSGPSPQPERARQNGMAAIGALLVVAVVTVITAGLLGRQASHYRLVQAEQTRMQSRWLLQGGVAWAQQVLRREAQGDYKTTLHGAWRQPILRLPVGGLRPGSTDSADGHFTGEIQDEAGKFNLRNIQWDGLLAHREVDAFVRLCGLLGIEAGIARRIVRRVAISLPDASGQGQAQRVRLRQSETEYVALTQAEIAVGLPDGIPRQAQAPQIMTIHDLLDVPGVTGQMIARLSPYVTVLPARSWINANTTSPYVLAAWVPGLSLEKAATLLAQRDRGQWFVNQGDIVNRLEMPELQRRTVYLGIQSNWFLLRGAVQRDGSLSLVTALLFDDKTSLPRVAWLREGA